MVFYKAKNKIWSNIVKFSYSYYWYPFIYKTYWKYKFFQNESKENAVQYLSQEINTGAGIGHQMANWISGYQFAKMFKVNFAHSPFSSSKWENFLGFGEDEVLVSQLIKEKGYKKVRLPLFDENSEKHLSLIKNIINAYKGDDIIFICEKDQFYKDQFEASKDLKIKFNNAKHRLNEKLKYSNKCYNIAIHIRRGDISIGQVNGNHNLKMRWQDINYFQNTLDNVIKKLTINRDIAINIFSQGSLEDFNAFRKYKNVTFHLEMNAHNSFLHMVKADLLITSKSSFSYKPAILSNGIKVCPMNFWHGYPKSDDFILVDDNGLFSRKSKKFINAF